MRAAEFLRGKLARRGAAKAVRLPAHIVAEVCAGVHAETTPRAEHVKVQALYRRCVDGSGDAVIALPLAELRWLVRLADPEGEAPKKRSR